MQETSDKRTATHRDSGGASREYRRIPRILVAEDDIEMRRLLAWQLRRSGFEVTECSDGYQLLDRVGNPISASEEHDFDLIVSDIRMPGVTGLEVLEDMHNQEWFTPMILITAFGDSQIHAQASSLGAAAIFDKPFDIENLIAKISDVLMLDEIAGDNWAPQLPTTGTAEAPLDIVFSDLPRSEYLKSLVRQAAEKLEPFGDKILYTRVVLVGPDHPDSGGRYHVQVMVTTARKVFVLRSNVMKINTYQQLCAAIPVAFEVTHGKIEKYMDIRKRNQNRSRKGRG
jgi:CheY-like chemotaxis protein